MRIMAGLVILKWKTAIRQHQAALLYCHHPDRLSVLAMASVVRLSDGTIMALDARAPLTCPFPPARSEAMSREWHIKHDRKFRATLRDAI